MPNLNFTSKTTLKLELMTQNIQIKVMMTLRTEITGKRLLRLLLLMRMAKLLTYLTREESISKQKSGIRLTKFWRKLKLLSRMKNFWTNFRHHAQYSVPLKQKKHAKELLSLTIKSKLMCSENKLMFNKLLNQLILFGRIENTSLGIELRKGF